MRTKRRRWGIYCCRKDALECTRTTCGDIGSNCGKFEANMTAAANLALAIKR